MFGAEQQFYSQIYRCMRSRIVGVVTSVEISLVRTDDHDIYTSFITVQAVSEEDRM